MRCCASPYRQIWLSGWIGHGILGAMAHWGQDQRYQRLASSESGWLRTGTFPFLPCFARKGAGQSSVCRLGGQNEVTPCMHHVHHATKALHPSNCMCKCSWQDKQLSQFHFISTRTVTRRAVVEWLRTFAKLKRRKWTFGAGHGFHARK